MDEDRILWILSGLREKATTEELLQVLNENDHEHWSKEGFEAIKRILNERKVNFKVFPERNFFSEVEEFFVKFRTDPLKYWREGTYVGKGKLVLSLHGVKIFGKTTFPIEWKVFIGTAIICLFIILSKFFDFKKLYTPIFYAPSLIILWELLNLLIVKKQESIIPWENILSIVQNPHEAIVVDFMRYPLGNPVRQQLVFKVKNIDGFMSELKKRGWKATA